MSSNAFTLSNTQINWLSANYPTVAHYTEGGGDYFSSPSSTSSNAGYSFGPFQFDVNTNANAQTFLTDIGFTQTQISELSNNGGLSGNILSSLSQQLQTALQDPANQALYQNLQAGQLQNLQNQLQDAINYAANNGQPVIANEILNDPSAQLRIMDYANQLGITPGGILDQFLSGQTVNMPATGNNLTINPNQSLDAQLQNFYQNTAAGANQTSSRVNNLNQGLESVLGGNGTNNQNGGILGLQLSYELGNAQKQVIDPLVLSMNGQAVTTTSLANGAYVDYQGTGFAEQSSWLSANAGILVDVTNPTGTLNNGFTIIGSSTTNQNGNKLGQAGFTQLATLDTNHDGVINASDTDFSQIEILVGSNGQPGSGHLETLAQAGITSISLNSTAVNTTDANGDKTLATSAVTYGNGTTGTLSDMNMSVNTSNTIDESAGTINSAYATLPDVAGWGDVHNLQVAMALDTSGTLAGLVQQYLAATPAQQATLINNLIFTWTGVQNNAPETVYHFTGDTREIDALSKFVGAQYSNDSGWPKIKSSLTGMPDLAGLTAGDSSNDAAWRMVA
jgi:hypothetical protein